MLTELNGRAAVVAGMLLCACCAGPVLGDDGPAGSRFVRVSTETAAALVDIGLSPRLNLDYGTFAWVELSDKDLARLRAAGLSYSEHAAPFALRLGEQSFDPLTDRAVAAVGWDAVRTNGPDLHLVQFVGPARADWLTDIEAAGLQIVQYIHPFTYVVWGDLQDSAVAGLSEAVRWTGPFLPAYRVLPRWRNLPNASLRATVLLYRGADTDATLEAFRAMGAKVGRIDPLNGILAVVEVDMPGGAFAAAARMPGVYTIQPLADDGGLRGEMSDQISVGGYNQNNQAYPGYYDWIASVGVDGAGVIIANVDGGVQQGHPDLVNRMLACTGQTCSSTQSSHGTHTAGIMAADGASGNLDSYGFLRGLGQAPGANLVEQTYSGWYTQPGGMLLLMTDSYNNGASLSGNSWGPSGSPLGYDNHTMQVDIGVRDADPNAPGNQPLTFVLSFMNGGGGNSTQGTPDEAKNLFNIGSTKMQNSNGSQILQIDDLSSNTAHGPALDGRTIPHMVAPGCRVDSSTTGSSYTLMCGTSMASPHVSGAVAVFIEYYRNQPDYTIDPSPALIKAAFLPVSHDLAGFHDADGGILGHPFDSKQGWGRMNLDAVVNPPLTARYFDNPITFNNTGEEWVTTLSPVDPSQPMKIMLVWTDAYGHGLGGSTPAWNNDLDLVVEAGANTYYGNNFDGNGWSQPGGSADYRNNTEGVFLGPNAPGAATIRVVAADINSDGVPNQGDATDQDFALVCYNCAEEPGFMLTPDPAHITLCAPDDAVYTIDVGQILDFTDPVTLSATGAPAGATVNFSTNPVTPPGSSTMTVSNTGAATPGTYSIDIEGASVDITRNAAVGLDLSNAVPGVATLIIPPDGWTGVSLLPQFGWSMPDQAAEYTWELAADAGFADIVETASGLTVSAYEATTTLDTLTTYYWRVRAHNACGVGANSATFSFTTRDMPAVLLVDDDDNSPDVRSYYIDALGVLAQDFDLWDTNNSDNEPDANTLGQYAVVVWFTGAEFGGSAGPGSAGEAALGSFLDGGGCLFLNSQDYHFDRGTTSFMQNYLGVSSVVDDVYQSTVTGAGSIFDGMGPYSLSYPFANWSDTVNPSSAAEVAFVGNVGNAAINVDPGGVRSIFWGFPWEAVSSPADRAALLGTVIDWCAGDIGDDCNENGVSDDDDIADGTSSDCNGSGVPDECEALGDFDFDCDVDMGDFVAFMGCFTGDGPTTLGPGCGVFDFDLDSDVDLSDFNELIVLLTGPN